MSKFTADNVGDFLEEIKKPAMKLMGVYALQVGIITCQYTSSIHTICLLFQHGACSIHGRAVEFEVVGSDIYEGNQWEADCGCCVDECKACGY